MAKISFEQAKGELAKLKASIEFLEAQKMDVPDVLREKFAQLEKLLTSNASAQVAEFFNNTIAAKLNSEDNKELREQLQKLVGGGARLRVTFNEKGEVTFEAGGSASTGSGSGNSGGSRSESEFNHWKVTNLKTNAVTEYDSAASALKAILNGGTNPMNLPAAFGKGNSAVRVLTSILPKQQAFAENFKVEGSKVNAPAKAAATTSEQPAVKEETQPTTETGSKKGNGKK